VCDFGLSRVATSVSVAESRGATNLEFDQSLTACGTPLWSAPEVPRTR
jgi:serine/threonine protein kinase